MGSSIDPRLAILMSALVEAEDCINSGRIKEGLEAIQRAENLLADHMDLELDQWREQSEFLP